MSERPIARRSTSDGKHVCLWADGSLTWALGYAIRGAWFNPATRNRERALRAGWLVLGDVELYEAADVPALVKAARWAADRDGQPGTMRARLHRKRTGLKPRWTVLHADRDGRPTERVWRLPGLGAWAGHVVWDYVNRGGSRGRYELHRRCAKATGEESYEATGIRFATQRELVAWMEDNATVVREVTT